ncbi:MAG: hypothetical protein ACLPSH_03145, partial [Vulcanimicrobiaceae bacterium]
MARGDFTPALSQNRTRASRLIRWDDGYQTCKIGSRVDGTNCIILNAGQRVVSWDDGYKSCKVAS